LYNCSILGVERDKKSLILDRVGLFSLTVAVTTAAGVAEAAQPLVAAKALVPVLVAPVALALLVEILLALTVTQKLISMDSSVLALEASLDTASVSTESSPNHIPMALAREFDFQLDLGL
jgi:hypothetical protein